MLAFQAASCTATPSRVSAWSTRPRRDEIDGHDVGAGHAVKSMLRRLCFGRRQQSTEICHTEVGRLVEPVEQFAQLLGRQSQSRSRIFGLVRFGLTERVNPSRGPIVGYGGDDQRSGGQADRYRACAGRAGSYGVVHQIFKGVDASGMNSIFSIDLE